MATAGHNDSSESEDVSDSSSESSLDREISFQQACRYYNSGGCKNGANCQYLHVCKFALKGNCRYGAKCKFNHDVKALSSRGATSQSATSDPKLTDGRLYQWQLDDGKGWKDIDNDDVIEAQYSLPHTKSIKIYNTQYGAVSISFRNVTVVDKKLSVRRLSDGNSSWVWYCMLHHKWIKYGEKDVKGKASPVSSSDIEKKFQNNPASSITFDIGGETYEIRFTEMLQVGPRTKAKVTRRPLFQQKQKIAGIIQGVQAVSLRSQPEWQFEGDSGTWHKYKTRSGTSTESSITSDDMERRYQGNPQDSFTFTVSGQTYKVDFKAMIQTNLKTKNTRKIRRVLV
ncbi:uncharacterized protein LOC114465402 isoform X2 [Gouania willdenowi]|uniref:uncharacterized protein LOC114465402 isoform X2 n=1 Tax=Gouania willdenowi TaxID=441366 RepID=UPI001055D3DB|nr:uncharacterized protein LOC114465402 isoform X2 [Gouania willdenowi]